MIPVFVKCSEEEKAYIDLKGENFNSNLRVWLGECECETSFKCSTNMRCLVPLSELAKSYVNSSTASSSSINPKSNSNRQNPTSFKVSDNLLDQL